MTSLSISLILEWRQKILSFQLGNNDKNKSSSSSQLASLTKSIIEILTKTVDQQDGFSFHFDKSDDPIIMIRELQQLFDIVKLHIQQSRISKPNDDFEEYSTIAMLLSIILREMSFQDHIKNMCVPIDGNQSLSSFITPKQIVSSSTVRSDRGLMLLWVHQLEKWMSSNALSIPHETWQEYALTLVKLVIPAHIYDAMVLSRGFSLLLNILKLLNSPTQPLQHLSESEASPYLVDDICMSCLALTTTIMITKTTPTCSSDCSNCIQYCLVFDSFKKVGEPLFATIELSSLCEVVCQACRLMFIMHPIDGNSVNSVEMKSFSSIITYCIDGLTSQLRGVLFDLMKSQNETKDDQFVTNLSDACKEKHDQISMLTNTINQVVIFITEHPQSPKKGVDQCFDETVFGLQNVLSVYQTTAEYVSSVASSVSALKRIVRFIQYNEAHRVFSNDEASRNLLPGTLTAYQFLSDAGELQSLTRTLHKYWLLWKDILSGSEASYDSVQFRSLTTVMADLCVIINVIIPRYHTNWIDTSDDKVPYSERHYKLCVTGLVEIPNKGDEVEADDDESVIDEPTIDDTMKFVEMLTNILEVSHMLPVDAIMRDGLVSESWQTLSYFVRLVLLTNKVYNNELIASVRNYFRNQLTGVSPEGSFQTVIKYHWNRYNRSNGYCVIGAIVGLIQAVFHE